MDSKDDETLQQVIKRSIDEAGKFLKKNFKMPEHSLSAEEIVALFSLSDGKPKTVALATVTVNGEPRVAPVGCHIHKKIFYIPSTKSAARTRHLRKRPGVSLTYYEGIDLALIIHGRAELLDNSASIFTELVAETGENVENWGKKGEGVFIKIIPNKIFSFKRHI